MDKHKAHKFWNSKSQIISKTENIPNDSHDFEGIEERWRARIDRLSLTSNVAQSRADEDGNACFLLLESYCWRGTLEKTIRKSRVLPVCIDTATIFHLFDGIMKL
ncbi:hypothetical protein KY285_035599 [Solanum tuberosum]|nr:hypothetical protein KY285_035599 [Solanum tuberosum]